MNTPEERNANHSSVDAQSDTSVDTGTPEVPEEITELRDLHATAQANADAAKDAVTAARAELIDAARKVNDADVASTLADQAEVTMNERYVDALRRHGYVQTADGPKPRQS